MGAQIKLCSRSKQSQQGHTASQAWKGGWVMELGTVSCCLATAELWSAAGQCSLFWHFPGPTCLVFKQRLQRELFHTGSFSPHQAVRTALWLLAPCVPAHIAAGSDGAQCQSELLLWAVRTRMQHLLWVLRGAQRVLQEIISVSAMWVSTCAKAAMLLNSLCPYCSWHRKHWLQTCLQPICLGKNNRNTENKVLANLSTLQASLFKNPSFPCPQMPAKEMQYLGFSPIYVRHL